MFDYQTNLKGGSLPVNQALSSEGLVVSNDSLILLFSNNSKQVGGSSGR